jgi:hypothetical protein
MTHYAREFIRAELSFSFVPTSDHTQALEWEKRIRAGELGVKPLINPFNEGAAPLGGLKWSP